MPAVEVSRRRRAPTRVATVVVVASLLAACSTGDDAVPAATGADSPVATSTSADGFPPPPPLHPEVDVLPAGTVRVDPGDGAEPLHVAVRIAATDDARRHGLMEVPEVPDGAGMWFSYEEDRTGGFWMRDTLVDLDIAWVDAAGRIVSTTTMEVCDVPACPSYEPDAAYRTALEVPAGWFGAHGVEVGDTAVLVARTP
jgi:uncharacterized membrane protein (UPF0127 family)